MKLQNLFVGALMVVSSTALAANASKIPAGTYNIDPAHSTVGFDVPHMVISSVDGKFDKYTGQIIVGAKPEATKTDVEIETASVNTGNENRDKHLKSPDFFDTDKFPKITFKSDKLVLKGNKLTLPGQLTIKGVTKPVTLEGKFNGVIKDMAGDQRMAAQVSGKINRKDFGLTWNKAVEAGPVVGDTVTLNVKIEAVLKK